MQQFVQAMDKGAYDILRATGSATGDHFVKAYARLFERRRGSENIYVLVDIVDQPSVVGMAEFTLMLHDAEECGIGHIWLFAATQDPARPLIGEMAEALSKNFDVNLSIRLFGDVPIAQKAIEAQISE